MDKGTSIKRILIFEDDRDYRNLLKTYIGKYLPGVELHEYDPVTKGAPPEDYDWSQYDVLILDYYLCIYGLTGLDLLQKYRKKPGFPATIMLTGAGNEEVAARALNFGVYDYLRKERLSKEQLIDSINTAFNKHNEELIKQKEQDRVNKAFDKGQFYRLLEHSADAVAEGKQLALLLVEVNDLAQLTSEYGLIVRDNLLRHIARQTYEKLKDSGNPYITRLGDESAGVLIDYPGSRDSLENEIQQLCTHFDANPYLFLNKPVAFTVSIGAVIIDQAGNTVTSLIDRANRIRNIARQTPGNSCHISTLTEIEETENRRREKEEQKRKAEEEAERERLRVAEEQKRKDEEERLRHEEEKRKENERLRMEEEKRKAAEAARLKAEEEERQRLEMQRRKEEAERLRLEEAKQKAIEAERQRLAELEKQLKAEEQRRKEVEAQLHLEAEKRKLLEEAEQQRKQQEEQQRRKTEEAAEREKLRQQEELKRRQKEEQLRQEEASRIKAEEDRRQKEEQQRKEAEARKQAEEEKQRLAEQEQLRQEEEKRKAEAELQRKQQEEEIARQKAEQATSDEITIDESILDENSLILKKAFNENRVIQTFQPVIAMFTPETGDAPALFKVDIEMVDEHGNIKTSIDIDRQHTALPLQQFTDRWILREIIGRIANSDEFRVGKIYLIPIGEAWLADITLFTWLKKLLTGIENIRPGNSIALELPVNMLIAHKKRALALIKALKQSYGFEIAIGEINTVEELRSLSGLKDFDLLTVKWKMIDELRKNTEASNDMAIISAFKSQGVHIIVDSIEDATVMTEAISLGADYVMGNFIGEPQSSLAGAGNVETFDISY